MVGAERGHCRLDPHREPRQGRRHDRRRRATVPPAILRALVKHPLTDAGVATFLADWKKTGQKI